MICMLYFLRLFQENSLTVRQKETKAILLGYKGWTETKKYDKISIRNDTLKSRVDGEYLL